VTAPAVRPRRGEIWWVRLPGQPADPHQPRPGLIVSADARNRLADDVIVAPIFSRGRLGPTRVALPAGAGGLPRDSVVFCDELTTIADAFLAGGPLGDLVPAPLMEAAVRAIRRAVGEVVPEPPAAGVGP
jgi:mRNA-degrading endonuclease toxin of MazEF toxin-antitoxin module